MYFTISIIITLASALSSTLATPILRRDEAVGTFSYGSPGMVTAKGFSDKPGQDTCNGVASIPEGPTVRLPKEWMNDTKNCGKPVMVYFRPRIDNPGFSTPPPFEARSATVYGTCVDCGSWEAALDQNLFDAAWPHGDPSKGTWGPAIVFGKL